MKMLSGQLLKFNLTISSQSILTISFILSIFIISKYLIGSVNYGNKKPRMQAKPLTDDMALQIMEEYDLYSNIELAKRIGVSTARLTKIVTDINKKSEAKGAGVILGSKSLRKQDDIINNAVDIYLKKKAGKE